MFFTVDVEDYFADLSTSTCSTIGGKAALVQNEHKGIYRILDLLDKFESKGTFFFVSSFAIKHPEILKETIRRGHEVASHGMHHIAITKMDAKNFFDDAKASKEILEDIGGKEVSGFRCPGFKLNSSKHWFFEQLINAGYKYDSSLLNNRMAHRNMVPLQNHAFEIKIASTKIMEYPLPSTTVFGIPMYLFGGVYLRFFPYWLIKAKQKAMLQENYLLSYIHPREMDTIHGYRSGLSLKTLKANLNLQSVEAKLSLLLSEAKSITISESMRL